MNRTYQVQYLGCKTNQSDALSFAGMLQRAGWKEASDQDSPELFVVQTCTVTMSADARGRALARSVKRDHPKAKILLTGCYAQRAEQELSALPEVDYVIGNLNPRKSELFAQIAGSAAAEPYPDFAMPAETPRTRPYIKIQDGCDARCSYCIIPSVRGKSRSLPAEEIVRRVEYYRNSGFSEMIFTGISMGGYGKDLLPRTNLAALMRRLDALPGKFKIRLSSLEPEEIDDEFVDVFTGSSRFQPHLHLPLQSASDRVLRKMRRQYLFPHFDSIVNRLASRLPDLNLGTDLLTGFPDEDDQAYQETKQYLAGSPIRYAHVFPFSPRPGTPAENYASSATCGEVTERSAELRAISRQKNYDYRRQFVGRSLPALLLHSPSEALTDSYIRVRLTGSVPDGGKVDVQIQSVSMEETTGYVLN
jgi:threonylcarbamoyladenosine tRNA methylthiotransferase MtaB